MRRWTDQKRHVFLHEACEALEHEPFKDQEVFLARWLEQGKEQLQIFASALGYAAPNQTQASELDAGLNASVQSLEYSLRAKQVLAIADEDDEQAALYERFHRYLFPEGLGAIIHIALEAQVTAVKALLLRCEEPEVKRFLKQNKWDSLPSKIERWNQRIEEALQQKQGPSDRPSTAEMTQARRSFLQLVGKLKRQLSDRFLDTIPEEKAFRTKMLRILELALADESPKATSQATSQSSPA